MALTNKLSAIGDAIREQTGKSELMTLDQMPQEIQSITTSNTPEEKQFETVLYKTSDYSGWGIIDQDSKGNPLNASKFLIGMDTQASGIGYLRIQVEISLTTGSKSSFTVDADPKNCVVYIDLNNGKPYALATKIGTGLASNGYQGDSRLVFSASCRQQSHIATAITKISYDFYTNEGIKVNPTSDYNGISPGPTYMLFCGVMN